jgi:hypothetical protein
MRTAAMVATIAMLFVVFRSPADAATVLCTRRNGAMILRDGTCRRGEAQVTGLSDLGVQACLGR